VIQDFAYAADVVCDELEARVSERIGALAMQIRVPLKER
jgi:hypothetical protein